MKGPTPRSLRSNNIFHDFIYNCDFHYNTKYFNSDRSVNSSEIPQPACMEGNDGFPFFEVAFFDEIKESVKEFGGIDEFNFKPVC